VDLDLRHLRTLNAIAEEGTFGRAANRLGYTQSTISQQIAALERGVGGSVFDRPGGPRSVKLTGLGELVLERGRRVLRSADSLGEAIERFQAGEGRIDIGTFQSVSTVILPALVSRLLEEHQDCQVRLFEEEPEDPRIGDLDMLFYDGLVDDDVETLKLLDDPYVLVARPGDFSENPVRLEHLTDRTMVAWPATCDQPRLEQALHASGSRPQIVFRSANNETLLSMVRSGLGFAIMPKLAVTGAGLDGRLQFHALKPGLSRELYLHWPRHRALSPLALRAIGLTKKIAIEMQEAPAEVRTEASS
jgi:DNA-binding transcriptional LysR family regulator